MTSIAFRPPSLRRRITGGRPEPVRAKIRVLVVDDHEFLRRALAAMIDAEPDMECCGAVPADGRAVNEVARRCPDLVMVDVSRRRGAGLDLVQATRRRYPHVRIVALAMYRKLDDVTRIFQAGAEACVRKLELAPRVLQAIRRIHARAERPSAGRTAAPEPVTRPERARLDGIEEAIAELIGRGTPSRAIAMRLGLSLSIVGVHRRRIRAKLNAPSATDLVELCVRWVQQRRGSRALFGL